MAATSVESTRRSRRSSWRAASRPSRDAPWKGIFASCSGSSKSASLAFVRERIGDLLERNAFLVQRPHAFDDERDFALARRERLRDRLRPRAERGAQDLLRAAERGHDPVREREHFAGRAVVVLEPDHGRVRKARRQTEQVRGRRPGECVDGLVVVADGAELVTIAEPAVEERLLQEVDVLVLVHRERAEVLAHLGQRLGTFVEETDRELEHVLEVDEATVGLLGLVAAEDAEHQIGRDRRLVVAELGEIGSGSQPAVLRPLHLGREVAGGTELVRRRQRVPELPEQQRLRGHDPVGRIAEPVQLA